MRKRSLIVVVVLAAMLSACGSGGGETTTSSTAPVTRLRVVTTTTQLTDFVKTIAGDSVDLYAMGKANVDPHDYEPTAADITALSKADYIVKNGVGLEKWFDSTMEGVEKKGSVLDASSGVTLRYADRAKKQPDPHIWQSPINAKIMVANITRALAAGDPANAGVFRGNEQAYDAQLDGLERSSQQALGSLPVKKLVTNHDTFGYFADEYGMTVVGSVIPSFDSQAELSSSQITDLVAKIKAEGVKAVFSESSLPPKTAETIAKEAGVKVVEGDDALYGDTLGPEGSDGDTYLKAMTHNTNVIVTNLR